MSSLPFCPWWAVSVATWFVLLPLQLRLAVVEALGPMSHLLPSEKLEEQLPKLLPGVLALYKKHAETSHVSKVRAQPGSGKEHPLRWEQECPEPLRVSGSGDHPHFSHLHWTEVRNLHYRPLPGPPFLISPLPLTYRGGGRAGGFRWD